MNFILELNYLDYYWDAVTERVNQTKKHNLETSLSRIPSIQFSLGSDQSVGQNLLYRPKKSACYVHASGLSKIAV